LNHQISLYREYEMMFKTKDPRLDAWIEYTEFQTLNLWSSQLRERLELFDQAKDIGMDWLVENDLRMYEIVALYVFVTIALVEKSGKVFNPTHLPMVVYNTMKRLGEFSVKRDGYLAVLKQEYQELRESLPDLK
jgi:hypothetical protein